MQNAARSIKTILITIILQYYIHKCLVNLTELRYMLKCIQLYVCDSQLSLKQQHHELVMCL